MKRKNFASRKLNRLKTVRKNLKNTIKQSSNFEYVVTHSKNNLTIVENRITELTRNLKS